MTPTSQSQAETSSTGWARAAVETVIREILPDYAGRAIPGHKDLKELGADSVDRVEIILTLVERLGLSDSMSSFIDLPDVDALVGYLSSKVGA